MEKPAIYETGSERTGLFGRMGIMTSEGMLLELEGLGRASVTFIHTVALLDPKGPTQAVTICLVRLLDGHCGTWVGLAACHPDEQAVDAVGERVALVRAVRAILPDLPREASHIARLALWNRRLETLSYERAVQAGRCRCQLVEQAQQAVTA